MNVKSTKQNFKICVILWDLCGNSGKKERSMNAREKLKTIAQNYPLTPKGYYLTIIVHELQNHTENY